jgi:predicted trehalose synthase
MSKKDDDDHGGEEDRSTPQAAKSELFAALAHLKNAAEILVAAADPAVRKVASEAEKALHKASADVEPVAQKLGHELGKMTRSLVDVLEGKRGARDETSSGEKTSSEESEIERLEREAKDAKD